jgi:hypothetical protein
MYLKWDSIKAHLIVSVDAILQALHMTFGIARGHRSHTTVSYINVKMKRKR